MRASAAPFPLTAIVCVMMAACVAPASPPTQSGPSVTVDPAAQGARSARSTLRVAYGAEVNNLATKLGGTVWGTDLANMSNAGLAKYDRQGQPVPVLGVELPSPDKGTWIANPDGTMRTTWRIKPNARWHDGQPVVATDFVFALKVYLDDAIPVDNRRPEQFMDRVEPLDDKTLVIHWKQPFPWADWAGGFEPLPEHLMGSTYQELSGEAFVGHPFWSSEAYVSTGPYRLTQWDRGTQLIFSAFDDFVLGRPKIETVIFRIIPDPNVVVASLLSGDIDVSVNIALGQRAGATVRDQWSVSQEGTVVAIPTRFRWVDIQFLPEYMSQPAINDLRVRRALVYGLDRETLAEVASASMVKATNVFLSPNDKLYARAAAAVPKYEYDFNRAMELLREAGWTRQGDALVNASGERFVLDILSSEGPDNETEQEIIAADYRKLGMDVRQTVYPRSRARDAEMRATFSGLNPTAGVIVNPELMRRKLADQCATEANRWVGANRGCWKNPSGEYDRLYQVAATSLNAAMRDDAMVQLIRIVTEDVGLIPLSYRADAIAFRKGLVGPGGRSPKARGDTSDVHEWYWE